MLWCTASFTVLCNRMCLSASFTECSSTQVGAGLVLQYGGNPPSLSPDKSSCCPGKHWTPAKVNQRTFDFLHKYKEKYIDTGSIKPLTDTMIGLFFFSYAVAWPQVRHLNIVHATYKNSWDLFSQ